MYTARELAKASWPEFREIFPIELVLSLCVISVVLGVLFLEARPLLSKARLSEAQLVAMAARIGVVEELAMSGELEQVRAAADVGGGYETFLSGEKLQKPKQSDTSLLDRDKRREEAQDKRDARESGAGVSQHVAAVRTVGTSIVVTAKLDGREYDFALRPAFPDDDTPYSYMWLCGARRAPDGWIALPPPAAGSPLPRELESSRCRRTGTR